MIKKTVLIVLIIASFVGCNNKQSKKAESKLYKGMFSYVEKTNEEAFTECGLPFQISMGIEKNKEYNKLFNAYEKVKTDATLDFAYVEFEGYVSNNVKSTEMDDLKIIVITKFVSLDKNKVCK